MRFGVGDTAKLRPLRRADFPNDLSPFLSAPFITLPAERLFVGNGEFYAAPGAAAFEYRPARLGRHPFTETVVVFSFSIRWLKRSFHSILILNRTAIYDYLPLRLFTLSSSKNKGFDYDEFGHFFPPAHGSHIEDYQILWSLVYAKSRIPQIMTKISDIAAPRPKQSLTRGSADCCTRDNFKTGNHVLRRRTIFLECPGGMLSRRVSMRFMKKNMFIRLRRMSIPPVTQYGAAAKRPFTKNRFSLDNGI
jgi:hypothetical protein